MFVAPAYAQTGGGAGGFDIVALLPLVLIFVVFYFLIIRPQQKKVKEHKALIEGLRRGDRVVTSGGIVGTVAKVSGDREILVEIADGVRVRVVKQMISEVLAKTEPAAAESKDAKKEAPREDERDYYKILGVPRNAGPAELEAAFAGKNGDAEASAAYETLKDPVKRKLYNAIGHSEYVKALKD